MMPNDNRSHEDGTVLSLPTCALLLATLLPAIAGIIFWQAAPLVGSWTRADILSGSTGCAVVGVVTAGGILLIRPWKPRPVIRFVGTWMVVTFFRLLMTSGMVWVLSSTPQFQDMTLALSVVAMYFMVLCTESIVLIRFLRAVPVNR